MAIDSYSILTIAARVYDQDNLSPRDEAFLDAINKAGRDHSDAIAHAAIHYGQGSDVCEAVMRLSLRQRDADYVAALASFEAQDDEEDQFIQAAAE
jgi:hypothetical protein